MGSFDLACSVSGIPITAGSPVVVLATRESRTGWHQGGSVVYPWDLWQIIGPPIRGDYTDYGYADGLDADAERLTMDLVAEGGYTLKGQPFRPASMDEYWHQLHYDGVVVADGKETILSYAMIHADVYDALLATGSRRRIEVQIASFRQALERQEREIREASAAGRHGEAFLLGSLGRGETWMELGSLTEFVPVLRGSAHVARMVPYLADLTLLYHGLMFFRPILGPQYGGQEPRWKELIPVYRAALATMERDKAAWDDEMGEDEEA